MSLTSYSSTSEGFSEFPLFVRLGYGNLVMQQRQSSRSFISRRCDHLRSHRERNFGNETVGESLVREVESFRCLFFICRERQGQAKFRQQHKWKNQRSRVCGKETNKIAYGEFQISRDLNGEMASTLGQRKTRQVGKCKFMNKLERAIPVT